jgi:nucleoside-diphosphate-sugar epimerase
MKMLVTGAAGFIGSHMAERLAAEGHEVVGLDCFTNYYAPALKRTNAASVASKGIAILPLDLATDDLTPALSGVEYVFHFAAQPGISTSVPFELYERNNVTATKRLLDACEQNSSLKGFINFATSSVYGKQATDDESKAAKPSSNYGVTKLAAEQLALSRFRDAGFPAASIRPFSICGPRERPEKLYPQLIHGLLTDTAIPLYDGSREHIRSFTYVGDLIEGAMLLLSKFEENKGEIFNIGSDTTNTVDEGITILEKLVGRAAKFDIKPMRPGSQTETAANIEKARARLGYSPKVLLPEALEQELAWYKEANNL